MIAAAVRSVLGLALVGVALTLAPSFIGASEGRATGPAAPSAATKAPRGAAPAQADVAPSRGGDERARRIGLDLSSDEPFEFDADTMDVVPDERRVSDTVRLSGNVTVTRGELKLTCDRLDAFFPEGYGQGPPQKFIASGAVHVVNGESELYCTQAEFEADSCIAICLSSETCQSPRWPEQPARFLSSKDSMEGRKLQFDQCTGQVSAACGVRVQVVPRAKAPDAVPAAPAEKQP